MSQKQISLEDIIEVQQLDDNIAEEYKKLNEKCEAVIKKIKVRKQKKKTN